MSTKTTFKRIALVAVASLGFGVLTSVAPANAAPTTGFSLSKSSITVVGANTGGAVFRIQLSQATAATAQSLQSDETLTVSVVGVPTGVTASKTVATNGALNTGDLSVTEGTVSIAGDAYSVWTPNGTNEADGVIAPSQVAVADAAHSGAVARSYYVRVAKGTNDPFDQGTYTLRFRLVKGDLLVREQTARVTFVSSAVDSGAKLSLTRTGTTFVGATGNISAYSATNNIKATLTDAFDGQVINSDGSAPALTLDSVTSTGSVAQTNGTLALVDDGSDDDFGYAGVASATQDPRNLAKNGTYGGTWLVPAIASETDRLRVRYGAASAFATSLVYPAPTATSGTATVTGTGIVDATGGAWTAPLTMTSATYTVALKVGAAAVQDEPVTITVAWSGSINAGDVKPVSGSTGSQVIKTSSEGTASITLTNSAPIDGAIATISATGLLSGSVTDQVITWSKAKPVLAGVLVSPNANYSAALKSTNTVTFTFLDAFGNPVVGDLIALSISGANNALGTVTIPSATTNAAGQVSYTWTDAAAVADEADAITATSTTVGTATATRSVTYKTTVPVIATLSGKFDRTVDASLAYPDVVPTTTIYTANGGSTPLSINTSMNIGKSLVSTSDTSQVGFRYTAKNAAGAVVTGVPVTVSISEGGHILGADGKPVASRIIYPATGGLVDFVVTATTVGTKTITVTAGAVSATAKVAYKNTAADARVLSATADASGVVKATVKDVFGNAVAGVDLTGTLTSGAEFGNRSNSMAVRTASDGTVSFSVLGTGTLTLETTTEGYGATDSLAGFADADGLTPQAGAPAGIGVVTLTASGLTANEVAQAAQDAAAEAIDAGNNAYDAANAAGEAADAATAAAEQAGEDAVAAAQAAGEAAVAAAEAATEAAAEATDAANAATDAANASAEAADAATAAAQDAADAVAALSTQVSEMITALKKQITALTNLVIKIQKKVKA